MIVDPRTIKDNTNRFEYLKIKKFCIAKRTRNKIEREIINWEKILAPYIPKG